MEGTLDGRYSRWKEHLMETPLDGDGWTIGVLTITVIVYTECCSVNYDRSTYPNVNIIVIISKNKSL